MVKTKIDKLKKLQIDLSQPLDRAIKFTWHLEAIAKQKSALVLMSKESKKNMPRLERYCLPTANIRFRIVSLRVAFEVTKDQKR